MNRERWEFTKDLLHYTKVNEFAVLDWAIWKCVCWVITKTKDKDRNRQREIVEQIVAHILDKWFVKSA